ncbi:MAG: hypothetical protein OER82_09040 [Nitrosopumilus sp.]|nr:hypothetical protein [Nitrosopumilus sp.]MDH3765941.1 hypothetical protein [Nitrosopumilus sp.]
MAIVSQDNNLQQTGLLVSQATDLINASEAVLETVEIDSPFVKVTYDDEAMTPQQKAQLQSDLSQLGLN